MGTMGSGEIGVLPFLILDERIWQLPIAALTMLFELSGLKSGRRVKVET